MILIGVTGIVGSGKTTVSNMLRKKGLDVIDLDRTAKGIIQQEKAIRDIQGAFGSSYIAFGKIDIKRVGELVFRDKEALEKLERIVHPLVMAAMWDAIGKLEAQGAEAVIVDGPLIFEKGLYKDLDKTVVVSAKAETITDRLEKRGMDREDTRRRVAAQTPLSEKEALADHVIYNNGSIEDLEKEVDGLLKKIKEWEVELDAS